MNRAAGSSDDELLAEMPRRGLGGGGGAALRGTGTIVQSSSAPRGVVLAVHDPAAAPVAMGAVVDVAEPDATRAGDATNPLYKSGLGLLFMLAGLSFGMALAAFAQQSRGECRATVCTCTRRARGRAPFGRRTYR